MNNYNQNSGCVGKRGTLGFGLLLTLAGLFLLASNLGWVDERLREVIFSWQIVFVIFMIISLFSRSYLSTFIFFALSVFFYLPKIAEVYPDVLPWVDADFARNFWPVLIVLLGIGIICGIFFGKNRLFFMFRKRPDIFSSSAGGATTDGVYARSVIFSGAEDVFLEPVFRGGAIDVVFGGVDLDLRKTTLPEGETHLTINAVFGGVEVHLPDNWKVEHKINAVFGGVDEDRAKLSHIEADSTRKLIITGDVVFGGVDIE